LLSPTRNSAWLVWLRSSSAPRHLLSGCTEPGASFVPSKAPSAKDFTALVTAALKAGFVELAYCILVIAAATIALSFTANGKGGAYDVFRWVAAGTGCLAFAFVSVEMTERAIKRWRGAS